MSSNENTCPIWGADFKAQIRASQHYDELIVDCLRCGGQYRLDNVVVLVDFYGITQKERARLTTWLVDQRAQGEACPRVTKNIIDYIKNKASLPAHERADRLLRFIAERATVGITYDIGSGLDPSVYAWSESSTEEEIGYFIDYLLAKGWLEANSKAAIRAVGHYEIPRVFRVTVSGHSRIEEQLVNADSSQGFIAMWFDESMEKVSTDGIEPAIIDAGYSPIRIDRKLDVRKIDDEIVAEIRRSLFLVADCTHGETKSRGSVYWEAGFAYGLGKEVIYSCRKDMAKDLPFDTRQYPYILWDTPADLRSRLKERISARLGDGPGILDTS